MKLLGESGATDQLSGSAGEDGLRFVEYVTRLGLVDLWDINISSVEMGWGRHTIARSKVEPPVAMDERGSRHRESFGGGVGRVTDPDEMVRVIRTGQLDIIGCAHPRSLTPGCRGKSTKVVLMKFPNASAAASALLASNTA